LSLQLRARCMGKVIFRCHKLKKYNYHVVVHI
jgi:hypothetical protein